MEDLEYFDMATESKQEVSQFPISDIRKKALKSNYRGYLEKKSLNFDFSMLKTDGLSDVDKADRISIAQSLIHLGFSTSQMNELIPLINKGFSFEDIKRMFGIDSSTEEIVRVVKEI